MTRKLHQMQAEERVALAAIRPCGLSLRAIGSHLGRSPGTLSHELPSNSTSDVYAASMAQAAYHAGSTSPQTVRKFDPNGPTWPLVTHMLGWLWSPQQIARTQHTKRPGRPKLHVSNESIARQRSLSEKIDSNEITGLHVNCDAGIVVHPWHMSHNIPSKLLTDMQSGMSVLANIKPGNNLAQFNRDELIGQVCESSQVDELLLLTEKLLDQIETDSGLSAGYTALFERQFAIKKTVEQILDAPSAAKAARS